MQPRGHGPGNTGIDPVLRDHRQASRGIIRRPVLQEPWRVGILRPAQQRQFVYIGREHICLCCQAAHRITPCFIKPIVQAAVVRHDRVHHQERIRRAVDSQKVRNAVPLGRIAEKAGDDAVRLYLLPVRSKLGHKAG